MMEVAQLTREEQDVLVVAARHLVLIDGELSDAELYELLRLGYAIGRDAFAESVARTDAFHKDRAKVLDFARKVTRVEAQVRIESELVRVAASDGLHDGESDFVTKLALTWRN